MGSNARNMEMYGTLEKRMADRCNNDKTVFFSQTDVVCQVLNGTAYVIQKKRVCTKKI